MIIDNQGIILNVFNFEQCVSFYKQIFHLPEMFSKVEEDFKLTCLAFGNAYLMLETGGIACDVEKNTTQNPTILRFNVRCIEQALTHIKQFDANATIIHNDWGNIIRMVDPDGNPISIREQAGFSKQITDQSPPLA